MTPTNSLNLPFNRALHTDDYPLLFEWSDKILRFEREMREANIPFRKDHEHRTWEYANVLRQLDVLAPKRQLNDAPVYVLDTGAGGSSLAPYLTRHSGFRVIVTDSMAYGDIVEAFIDPQCKALNIHIPVVSQPVEAMPSIPDNLIDVTMCISVIEHVGAEVFEQGLKELCRVTKPGGVIFITSDFFADEAQSESSPFKNIQHTCFTPELAGRMDQLLDAEFVGEQDFRYRGHFVHNYSFVNMVFRKRG